MNKKHRLKLLWLLSFYASVSHAQFNSNVDSNLLSGHHTQPQVWGIVIFVMIILLAASYFLTKAINNRKKNSP